MVDRSVFTSLTSQTAGGSGVSGGGKKIVKRIVRSEIAGKSDWASRASGTVGLRNILDPLVADRVDRLNHCTFAMKHRIERVCEIIKRELGSIIVRELTFSAPLVTVSAVDITPDLKRGPRFCQRARHGGPEAKRAREARAEPRHAARSGACQTHRSQAHSTSILNSTSPIERTVHSRAAGSLDELSWTKNNEFHFRRNRSHLGGVQNILVASHLRPDGDALGSTIAFSLWLKSWGKMSPPGTRRE